MGTKRGDGCPVRGGDGVRRRSHAGQAAVELVLVCMCVVTMLAIGWKTFDPMAPWLFDEVYGSVSRSYP